LIKCLLVFSFGLCWCDAQEVCGPSVANVHVKECIFACHCVVQGFTMYVEGYRESNFFRLLLLLVPNVRRYLSQPHFGAKCEDETHTPKVGDLESSGTPECLGLDSRG
jgi:hypothetical protein